MTDELPGCPDCENSTIGNCGAHYNVFPDYHRPAPAEYPLTGSFTFVPTYESPRFARLYDAAARIAAGIIAHEEPNPDDYAVQAALKERAIDDASDMALALERRLQEKLKEEADG